LDFPKRREDLVVELWEGRQRGSDETRKRKILTDVDGCDEKEVVDERKVREAKLR